jgi:hypothetical protein
MGSQMLYTDPGQYQEPSVVGQKMNALFSQPLRPANVAVPASDVTGSGRPGQTGNGSFPGIDNVFKLLSDRMTVSEIMVLLDQAVIELF